MVLFLVPGIAESSTKKMTKASHPASYVELLQTKE